jgi:hypothetical protein
MIVKPLSILTEGPTAHIILLAWGAFIHEEWRWVVILFSSTIVLRQIIFELIHLKILYRLLG